ncbi:MAG: hypothetical protein AMXMBFR7_43790 [Planctomycetota bacterium]
MSSFASALKSEISRIARKESRAQAAPLHRASTQYRRDVAALKRQVARLTKQVAFLEGQERSRVAQPVVAADTKARFSPMWLKKHRAKLDLSAEQYAKLAGASAQSVYFWELGKTKPRASQVAALAALRGLGKREALERLRVLEGA